MFLQVALTLLLALALVVPTGRYLYRVFSGGPAPLDGLFLPVERLIYRLIGVKNPQENMEWKAYALALLVSNGVMALVVYVLFRLQAYLPLNPGGVPSLEPTLAFNTAISFVTNTNLQHYGGENTMTNLNQMAALTFLMFTSAAAGLATAIAFVRGLSGRPLGNYWADTTRAITRVLLPASLVVALFFIWQGSPQTLSHVITARTVEGTTQNIVVGPVASMMSIKHIGTNGGGFYGANSAHPFENPTPLTNLVQILSMLWLPTSLVYTFGLFAKSRRQAWVLFGAAATIFVVLLASAMHFEAVGNPALHAAGLSGQYMEGKEVRFGVPQSTLFMTVTTAATTGSVNTATGSLTPMGSFTALLLMMLNSIFGGNGIGLMQLATMTMISVFLVGLMVGHTPEFLRKKLETNEIVLLAIVILVHPLITLLPQALSLVAAAGRAGLTQTGFRAMTQSVYEFTSAAANNGSEFGGINANTPFWNISTGIVMLLGRYPSMVALLAVSGLMAVKKPVPEGPGTLRTDTPLFGAVLVGVILIVGALTFFPALALGPIGEHLAMMAGK